MNQILNEDELTKYRMDINFLKPIIQVILEKENISSYETQLFENGSSIVIDIGNNSILKIFPLFFKKDFEAELNGLKILNLHNINFIPKIHRYGEVENYNYIIVSKINGVTLHSVWHNIEFENKISIMNDVGLFLKSMHSIPLDNISKKKQDWNLFLENQINNCTNYHAKKGVSTILLSQIDKFISQNLQSYEAENSICFLSGDVHYWNILVEEKKGRSQISGFIDYGDSFFGMPEYDFLAPGHFMANGGDDGLKDKTHTAKLLKPMFLSYGYSEHELNEKLSHRLFAFHLIHRFSDLSKLVKNSASNNLYALAEQVWRFK